MLPSPRGKRNPMRKYANEAAARKHAGEASLFYGFSTFSNGWFVGTAAELKKIGVVTAVRPPKPGRNPKKKAAKAKKKISVRKLVNEAMK